MQVYEVIAAQVPDLQPAELAQIYELTADLLLPVFSSGTSRRWLRLIAEELKTMSAGAAASRIEKLQSLCAAVYQVCGALDAPVAVLDALSDAAHGTYNGEPLDLLPQKPSPLLDDRFVAQSRKFLAELSLTSDLEHDSRYQALMQLFSELPTDPTVVDTTSTTA